MCANKCKQIIVRNEPGGECRVRVSATDMKLVFSHRPFDQMMVYAKTVLEIA